MITSFQSSRFIIHDISLPRSISKFVSQASEQISEKWTIATRIRTDAHINTPTPLTEFIQVVASVDVLLLACALGNCGSQGHAIVLIVMWFT